MEKATLLFTSVLTVAIASTVTSLSPSCPSNIYCHGKLLHTIQMSSIFHDSKTFVDMKMKEPATITLAKFDELMKKTNDTPTVDELKTFLNDTFEPPGSEFETWNPSDWHAEPKYLSKINDRALRKWASDLHGLWKMLGRKMKTDVEKNSDLYSIIPVPHPVIVPGGRFREFYYWDSYWIVRGLLLSEMYGTVKGMLGNFISIIERYGFIPNGGRVYYLMRSQPPLFIPMVDSYLEFTNDTAFLKDNIQILEKEFQFWMNNRTVMVNKNDKMYKLCRYGDQSYGPRPESYREDIFTAQYLKDDEKDKFYSELKSAAESGWDFSTRWFIPDGTKQEGNLTDIKIKSIVPVDLNAIIYWNAKLLSKFYNILKEPSKSEYYKKISENWLEAVTEILWHGENGIWLDYDMINRVKRDFFYPSNLAPLWTNCYPEEKREYFIENVIKYINKSQVFQNLGGIPTSIVHSGEQWDYPNAWPPLQHIIIMGLDQTKNPTAQYIAFVLAEKWISSNFKAYKQNQAMYEKYDATIVGGHGGGGEYEVQLGFGWTNGVIMDLLDKYGDRLLQGLELLNSTYAMGVPVQQMPTHNAAMTSSSHHFGPLFTLILAFGATITAGCIGAIVYAKRYSPNRPEKSQYLKIPGSSYQ